MDILLRIPGGFPETHTPSGEKRFLPELSYWEAASFKRPRLHKVT